METNRPTRPVRVLVILQNAWSSLYDWLDNAIVPCPPDAGAWARPSWFRATERSRTGKTLARIGLIQRADWWTNPDTSDVWIDETTPEVACGDPGGVCNPRPDYVRAVLAMAQPRIVLAMGAQAERVLRDAWPGRLIGAPHPAYRVANTATWALVARLLELDQFDRVCVRAGRDGKASSFPMPQSPAASLPGMDT